LEFKALALDLVFGVNLLLMLWTPILVLEFKALGLDLVFGVNLFWKL